MTTNEQAEGLARSSFARRLRSMGVTAAGAEAVLKSILRDRAAQAERPANATQGKLDMNAQTKPLAKAAVIAATLAIAALSGEAIAGQAADPVKLLTASFAPRDVAQVEAGDFHFAPGQAAPVHTHDAPAVGVVVKGAILYQVEGEAPQLLREGDAFYEPAGPRILRFDNASATQEAIFVDFNLQQTGEPFIVFEKPLTETIDRRTLPTFDLGGATIEQVDIYRHDLVTDGALELAGPEPILGIVAEGVVELRIDGEPAQRVAAGQSFHIPAAASGATVTNVSSEVSAELVAFYLR